MRGRAQGEAKNLVSRVNFRHRFRGNRCDGCDVISSVISIAPLPLSRRCWVSQKAARTRWEKMPIALVVVPLVLAGSVFGLIGFASQETEDMSPAETTMRLNK